MTTPPVWVFFNREIGLAKIYPFTKLEVFSFTLSILREGVPKLKKNGPRPLPRPL